MSHENLSANGIESLRPDLIPAENYRHPFCALIAEEFWNVSDNPDRAYLTQQVLPVASTLTPEELLEAGTFIERDFPAVFDAQQERIRLWPEGSEQLSVDEDGNVQATIGDKRRTVGHVSKVLTFLNEHYAPEKDTSGDLEEVLLELVMEAAENYKGFQHAIDVEKALNAEICRRIELPRQNPTNGSTIESGTSIRKPFRMNRFL